MYSKYLQFFIGDIIRIHPHNTNFGKSIIEPGEFIVCRYEHKGSKTDKAPELRAKGDGDLSPIVLTWDDVYK